MSIYYRKAKQKDIRQLVDARIEVFEETTGSFSQSEKEELYNSSVEYMKKAMKVGSFFAFMAFEADNFAGMCCVNLYKVMPERKLLHGKRAYMQNVYVLPQYRGKGVAEKLVMLAIEEAKLKGHERIELHVPKIGKALFEKCGFKDSINNLDYMVCN